MTTQALQPLFGIPASLAPSTTFAPFAALAPFAQAAQAAIAAGREWSAQQSSSGLNALHTQLDLVQGGAAAASVRQLFALQAQFFDGLAAQQKEVLKQVGARAETYASDLRQTVSSDEVGLVTVGFFKDLGQVLQNSAEQAASLLNSTSAAATVLSDRALAEAAKGQ